MKSQSDLYSMTAEETIKVNVSPSGNSPVRDLKIPGVLVIISILILILACPAQGRDFVVKRSVKGYKMAVTLSENPPILGKNVIKLEIKDSQGEPVAGASAIINYFMPPMPGMPPMNYKVKADPDNDEYTATMDLIMEGPWNITVMAKVAGERLKMTVLIDVR